MGRVKENRAGLRDHGPQVPGAEFKAVVVPLTTSHYVMLARNLICTGITRDQAEGFFLTRFFFKVEAGKLGATEAKVSIIWFICLYVF